MIAWKWLVRAACFIALVALVGCSGGDSGSFARVSGIVTHSGNPIADAKVTFYGTTETAGQGRDEFSTLTDSSGKYVISGVGKNPGIPPGRYKVVVTKLTVKAGVNVPEDFDLTQLEMSGLGVSSLPKEYGSETTTKLSATLEPGKNENVNFDLKGK
jgi:hypothetical protein